MPGALGSHRPTGRVEKSRRLRWRQASAAARGRQRGRPGRSGAGRGAPPTAVRRMSRTSSAVRGLEGARRAPPRPPRAAGTLRTTHFTSGSAGGATLSSTKPEPQQQHRGRAARRPSRRRRSPGCPRALAGREHDLRAGAGCAGWCGVKRSARRALPRSTHRVYWVRSLRADAEEVAHRRRAGRRGCTAAGVSIMTPDRQRSAAPAPRPARSAARSSSTSIPRDCSTSSTARDQRQHQLQVAGRPRRAAPRGAAAGRSRGGRGRRGSSASPRKGLASCGASNAAGNLSPPRSKRPDHHRAVRETPGHAAEVVGLLRLRRQHGPAREQELGAQQPDALGARAAPPARSPPAGPRCP